MYLSIYCVVSYLYCVVLYYEQGRIGGDGEAVGRADGEGGGVGSSRDGAGTGLVEQNVRVKKNLYIRTNTYILVYNCQILNRLTLFDFGILSGQTLLAQMAVIFAWKKEHVIYIFFLTSSSVRVFYCVV